MFKRPASFQVVFLFAVRFVWSFVNTQSEMFLLLRFIEKFYLILNKSKFSNCENFLHAISKERLVKIAGSLLIYKTYGHKPKNYLANFRISLCLLNIKKIEGINNILMKIENEYNHINNMNKNWGWKFKFGNIELLATTFLQHIASWMVKIGLKML